MDDKEVIKPCPFCEGKAELKNALDAVYWVKCSVCSAESGNYCTEKEAVDVWNKVAEKCENSIDKERVIEKLNGYIYSEYWIEDHKIREIVEKGGLE